MRQIRPRFLLNSRIGELIRASSWLFGSRVLSMVLGFITSILVARWFGKEATGFLALINSVTIVFSVVSTFGLSVLVMRDFSATDVEHETARKRMLYQRVLFVVFVIFVLLVGPALFILLPGFSEQGAGRPFAWLALAAVALFSRTMVVLNVDISRGLIATRFYGLLLLAPTLITFLVTGTLVLGSWTDPILPSVALTVGMLATGVATLLIILTRLRVSKGKNTIMPKEIPSNVKLIRQGFPFAISALSAILVSEGNIVVASFFLPIDEIGIYAIAHKLALLVTFVLTTFAIIASPQFSRLSAKGEVERLKTYGQQISTMIFWGSIPVLLVLVISRRFLIETAFGAEFLPAAPVLMILLAGQFVNALTGVTNPFLNMTGGHVLLSWIAVASAIINIGLSLLLVPLMGILGAAIAMSVSLAFWNIVALIAIRLRNGFWICYLPWFFKTKPAQVK